MITTYLTVGSLPCPHDAKLLLSGGKNYDHMMKATPELFLASFEKSGAVCTCCGRVFDLYLAVREFLGVGGTRKPFMLISGPLGLPGLIIPVVLEPHKPLEIKLQSYGLPSKAKILDLNITPQDSGGLWPAQIVQNQTIGAEIPHNLTILPWQPTDKGNSTKISIFVTWVEESFIADSFVHIVDAVVHYTHNQNEKAMRSAQLGIEEPLRDLVSFSFEKHSAFKSSASEMIKGRRHLDIVNSVLPAIADDLDIPKMSTTLRKGIVKLAESRNKSSHSASASINEEDARDGIVAALLGLYYAIFFKRRLSLRETLHGRRPMAGELRAHTLRP